MAAPAPTLREIHRLLRYARDLQDRIERGPRVLKAQQGRVERQKETLHEAQDALKRLKVKMHEDEVTLKSTLQQITKHEKQQEKAESKKEYDALKSEIEAARKKVRQLEDGILEALAQSEEDAAKLPELEKAVQQVRDEVTKYQEDYNGQLAGWTEELAKTRRQVAEVEATLPPDVRMTYDRLTRHKGEDALAAVVNRTCTACHHEITAQNANDLLQGNFVVCKSCGRMLYPAE